MMVISYNIRGLSSCALERLVEFHKPDILMIQETMIGDKAKNILSSFLKGWPFVALDVVGKSGGGGHNLERILHCSLF